MADPYVIFPGTPGVNVQTDDVNLLDADTAHVYQSSGLWGVVQYRCSMAITDGGWQGLVAPFGKSIVGTVNTASVPTAYIGTTTPGPISVPGGAEVTISADVASDASPSAGADGYFQIGEFEADGQELAGPGDVRVPVSSSSLTKVFRTWTTKPTTAFLRVRLYIASRDASPTMAVGEEFVYQDLSLQVGSAQAFIPSLRIDGTLYEETVPVDMPVVFAADGSPLTVGEGWAGNGVSYARYDGADASGLLVASFQAGDVPVAAQLPA